MTYRCSLHPKCQHSTYGRHLASKSYCILTALQGQCLRGSWSVKPKAYKTYHKFSEIWTTLQIWATVDPSLVVIKGNLWHCISAVSVFPERMGHPQPIELRIIKRCPKLPRIYSSDLPVLSLKVLAAAIDHAWLRQIALRNEMSEAPKDLHHSD